MFSDKREGIGMDEETPLLSILPHVNTVAGSGTSNFPILAHSPRDERESRILKGYLHGQLASVAKFGIWWTMLSPLVLALFNGKTIYVGLTRTAFNSAMLILSPFAGLIVEHRSILTTLNFTNIFRCLIYCILLPFSWMMFRTNWILRDNPNNDTFFLIAFLILMFADGACVTFSNVVDIDCGGTQLLAEQHEISLDDYTRNRYNGLHVAFFDGSIISMCPFVALVGVTVSEFTSLKNLMPTSIFQPSLLLGMMGVTFFVFSSYSLFWCKFFLIMK